MRSSSARSSRSRQEHPEYFDHRREFARTDVEQRRAPRREWDELLVEMMRRADAAGIYRHALPAELGGADGTNLDMAIIREHLASKPLGLHSDLQTESACVGNFPIVLVLHALRGRPSRRSSSTRSCGTRSRAAFGLTEPDHGSDATWLETTATRDGGDWVINGMKRFNTGMHVAQYDIVFARTSGRAGQRARHHRVPRPDRRAGLRRPLPLVDVQHALRPRRGDGSTDVRVPRRRDRRRMRARAWPRRCCSCTRTASARRRRRSAPRSSASTRRVALRARADRVRQAARDEPGDPVPARRAAHRLRAAARADPHDRGRDGRAGRPRGVSDRSLDVQLPGEPARVRRGRPRDPGPRRDRLHARTSRSSTSTATTAATGSPRAPRRSSSATSPAACSASGTARRARS